MTVNGAAHWNGGTISGAGRIIVNGSMQIAGGGLILANRTIDIASSANVLWLSGVIDGNDDAGGGGTINNAGIFESKANDDYYWGNVLTPVFNNTGTFLKTGGDLRDVMRTMLESKEFWSVGAYRSKVKSPLQLVASAVRAVNGDVDFAAPLVNQLAQLGQPLYRKQEPTGYSNKSSEWVNSASLLARMNFSLALTNNKVPGIKVDLASIQTSDPLAAARTLLMTDLSPDARTVITQGLADQSGKIPPAALVAGLTLGSPDFQRR